MKKYLLALSLLAVPVFVGIASLPLAAQSTISGDIQGVVTDPTGAAVSGAKVVVGALDTGSVATATSGSAGSYHFSLLKPGAYRLTITAPGFDTTTRDIAVSQGNVTDGDIKLTVGKSSTTVEVDANTVPLLQTEDAQLSTTFNQEQVQDLPNPGGDITFYAQTAPGVVMNTGGGYGNFSVFGLPGTSNNFTVNGEQENDPFLNLNNSGPTNLLLGQNDISSVNVLTSAYGAEFGSFGGAQVQEISRSGANKFHGDLSYWWNGRSLNANDWFLKQNQAENGQSSANFFSNANQWAAAVGGPIVKDKTFFFINTEGIRFITAPAQLVYIPSAAYETGTIVNPGVLGGDSNCDDASSTLFNAGNASECGYYKQIFALYANAPGAANAVPTGDPLQESFVGTPKIFAKESLVTARIDQVIGSKDSMFIHYKYDNGTQPTHADPISSAFNDVSNQPENEGQLVETHAFSPNLINQFLVTGAHYGALFTNVNQSALPSIFNGGTLLFADGEFTNIGGIDYAFPEGRNATQYQIADDISWTKKAHTLKFGYAFKKDDISDFDPEVFAQSPLQVVFGTQALDAYGLGFDEGNAYEIIQSFPSHFSNGVGLYSEGFYAQDTWKASPTLTMTAGIRFEHNSNPTSARNGFSRLNTSVDNYFASPSASDPTAPYNSLIAYNQSKAFNSFEAVSYEPRFEVAYSISPKTVIRGGFGMFSDVFPGQVADDLLDNSPQDNIFTIYGSPIDPALANSGSATAVALNTAFSTGTSNFYNGGSLSTIGAENPNLFSSPPSLTTTASNVHYPTYEEYSLQIQQQISPNTAIQIAYAGNHGYHEPVVDGSRNAYNGLGTAFGGVPAAPPSVGFGQITEVSSTASSNYNGGIVSLVHHSKYVNAQLNYTYSHTLDQISNGGFLGFTGSAITGPLVPGSLVDNYGDADYDIRNSLNGNYLVNIPGYGGRGLRLLTDGWQVSGNVFYRSGFPFTVIDSAISGNFANYSGAVPAQIVNTSVARHCTNSGARTPCLQYTDFTDPTNFIPSQRNTFTGPHYFNTDFSLNKAVKLPYERVRLIVGANAYNVLNHPNFANPDSDTNSSQFGQILSTVSVPTSIYGSGLGGDASPRILQLHAKVSF